MAKFDYRDLELIRSDTIARFNAIPTRCRLTGMTRDLDENEKRIIAYISASLVHLNRLGITKPEDLEGLFPEVFTEVQEVIEDGVVRHNFTKQK